MFYVTSYDIRPGNGVGQFLLLRSPHGALTGEVSWLLAHCDMN